MAEPGAGPRSVEPYFWILCILSHSSPVSGSSSAALGAVGAPGDHVVSATLGHITSVQHMDALPVSCHGLWAGDLRIGCWESLWAADSGTSLWRSWLMWHSAAVLGVMDDGQTVSPFPAWLKLSLAFRKAVSLVQISCLGLFKKTAESLSWLKLL